MGTTVADGRDTGPVPFALVATTVHRYVRAFVTPVTVTGERLPVACTARPPFVDAHATVKPMMALPPSGGAVKLTEIWALPALTCGAAGRPGSVLGTTATDGGEFGPVPFAFAAVTVHV
jgi:hypothetical protein